MSTPATWTASCTSGAGECGSGGDAGGLASGAVRMEPLGIAAAIPRSAQRADNT